jgi:hypothetical protein
MKRILLFLFLLPVIHSPGQIEPGQNPSSPFDASIQANASRKDSLKMDQKRMHELLVKVRTDSVHDNFLKLNLARLFGLEIAFSYERKISPSTSFEMEVGYGFSIVDRSTPGSGDLFETNQFLPGESFSIWLGPKIYRLVQKRPGFYIEPFAEFKFMRSLDIYFPSDYSVYPDNGEHYPFGDKYTNIYGISMRIGTVRNYGGVIVDYYAGLGLKLKDYTYYYYGYYNHYDSETIYYFADHTPIVDKDAVVYPVINLGIKMGFGF